MAFTGQVRYSALYKLANSDIAAFEAHCVELQRVSTDTDDVIGAAVDSFAELLREKQLGSKWEFVAYLLFLLRPERFFPIRSTHFERVLTFYGVEAKIAGRVEWSRYKLILDVAEAVKDKLSIYGSATALQAQSYMWVISNLLPIEGSDDREVEVDFEEELRRRQEREKERQRIGVLGERYVYESERKRLRLAGRTDLAARVSLISRDDEAAGYDVASFEVDGSDLHIEVKATTRSRENDSCFWLSANEVSVAMSDPRWKLYRVWQVDCAPEHESLGNIVQYEPDGWNREPSTWVIRRKPGQ